VKTLCKALTSRLQAQIGSLVDEHQSGFLSGCSISENFVFATELVQSYFKRKTPTPVLDGAVMMMPENLIAFVDEVK
jgi:DNA integrity scanning protein DisA with diadenylate cyclase activity